MATYTGQPVLPGTPPA